ncbi:predicted protein [Naegleria gruberi]|uniref:Predicted protein n=1 Tax=Naegleria gruberi TaxID=5762 RepID=D2VES1_NAEGR|nr:uncharacterized protein NAEGRDRAFT_57989 [Naegleria gruberi]EFC44555.1 predicted protein [Naegleria gruberi]|eukprot:XP_002677299.1 predicted protein [Naegleria gruberi strain NEG-M]
MKKEDIANVKPYGFDNNGKWIPIELSECLRFNRYKEGNFFKPHMDSHFVRNDNERSIFTILIYLDDSPYGTTFWKKIPDETNEELASTKMNFKKLLTVQPKAGSIAIFNHDIYHSGDFVNEGYKYVVRTEMIFKRIDPESVYRQDYRETAEFQKVKQLVDESNQLEKEGNLKLSTQKYIQAHELQTTKANSIQKVNISNRIGQLPEEMFLLIFSFMKTEEISNSFIKLDRNLNSITRHSKVWKERYCQKWSDKPKVPLNKANGFKRDYYYQMDDDEIVEEGTIYSMENAITIQHEQTLGDWYHAFAMRSNQEKFMEVVLLDFVGGNYRYGLSSQSLFYVSPASCGIPNHPHFSLVGYDYQSILCGDRYFVSAFQCDDLPLMERNGQILDMRNFKEMITQLYRDDLKKSMATPLLISIPVVWTDKQLSVVSTELINMGLDVIFIDEAKLRSFYYQKPNCLIIKLTENGIYFIPVKENEMVRKYYHLKDMKNQTSYPYPSILKIAFIPSVDIIDETVLNVEPIDIGTHYNPKIVGKEERVKLGTEILLQVTNAIEEYKNCIENWKSRNVTDNIIVVGEFAHLENMKSVVIGLLSKNFPNSSITYQENHLDKTVKIINENSRKMGYRGGSFDVVGGAKIICSLSNFREDYYEKRSKKKEKRCTIA